MLKSIWTHVMTFIWALLVFVLPGIITSALGYRTGYWGAGLGLALAWLGYCVYQGSMILGQRDLAVIVRFGKYRTVYFRGWKVLIPFIEKVREKNDMSAKKLQMYWDENGRTDRAVMDFAEGGSAPVDALVWYQIGNPEDLEKGNWRALREQIKKWTYAYGDQLERIDALVDGELRPLLQAESIDEASKMRTNIENTAIAAVESDFHELGVYFPNKRRGIIIEDIDLPPKVVELRELELEGLKKAQASVNRASGYWEAIKQIAKNLDIPIPEARAIYETQRGLETLEAVKPTLTLMSRDFGGALATINLNSQGGGAA